jgi:hypothetical protein
VKPRNYSQSFPVTFYSQNEENSFDEKYQCSLGYSTANSKRVHSAPTFIKIEIGRRTGEFHFISKASLAKNLSLSIRQTIKRAYFSERIGLGGSTGHTKVRHGALTPNCLPCRNEEIGLTLLASGYPTLFTIPLFS